MSRAIITEALSLIFQGIQQLEASLPNRAFTIDGRLVGDPGEVIAALEYDLVLHATSQPTHDANSADGRLVQIKATFLIYERYATRKAIGRVLLSFPINELRKLSARVPKHERIARRVPAVNQLQFPDDGSPVLMSNS